MQNLNQELSKYKQDLLYLDENGKMIRKIMEQFKTTISELISNREKQRAYADIEKERIVSQKSQLIEDLLSAECAYKDVRGKYERTKEVIARYKNDEDKLKKCVADKREELTNAEQHFERLRCHAEDKVSQANQVILQIKTSREVEIAKLTAMLRKSEIRVETLEQKMKQKTDESKELANMCDELINCADKNARLNTTI